MAVTATLVRSCGCCWHVADAAGKALKHERGWGSNSPSPLLCLSAARPSHPDGRRLRVLGNVCHKQHLHKGRGSDLGTCRARECVQVRFSGAASLAVFAAVAGVCGPTKVQNL